MSHDTRSTADTDGQAISPAVTTESHAPRHNRPFMIAVLALVIVVTIYIVKTNIEQPAASSNATGQQPFDPEQMQAEFIENAQHQIAHISDILAQDSSNFDAWVALGNLYFDIDDAAGAIAHYTAALALQPDNLNVKTDLATMERAAGHPERAISLLNEVVAADSTAQQAWFNLGVIYSFDLNDSRNAIAAWKRFIQLNPQSEHSEPVLREIERLEAELGG
jgi:cytochrome c-type biogenesis protein CcmH/NrfG